MSEFQKFKKIPNFDNYYIDELGNIMSFKINYNKYIKKLKVHIGNSGYNYVGLVKNKIQKKYFIHRLMALTYLSNSLNKSDVNHKDGNKLNNTISNLEWCTKSENMLHSYNILKQKPIWLNKKGSLHNLSKKVIQLDKNNNILKIFGGVREASRELNLNNGHISSVCLGNRKSCGGFKWEYL